MANAQNLQCEIIMTIEETLRTYTSSEEVLRNTPRRFFNALHEMLKGYHVDVESILSVQFEQQEDVYVYDGIVCLKDIPFVSVCEHHLLPFQGVASVGYKINKQNPLIVGLSKIARLVDAYACRLQVQERLCQQIAYALNHFLKCEGSFCIIKAEHSCLKFRGAEKHGAVMVTCTETGCFETQESIRQKLYFLLNGK